MYRAMIEAKEGAKGSESGSLVWWWHDLAVDAGDVLLICSLLFTIHLETQC